jgi:hypothetical protein
MSIKPDTSTKEIEAYVRDILLQIRHFGIWISYIGGNASRIVIAVRQASFFCLRAHWLRVRSRGLIIKIQVIESAATVIQKL